MDSTLDLTARDFEANLQYLQDYILRTAPGQWNSFQAGDLGTVLLEAIAYDATLLTYMADAQFRETFLDSLTQWESLNHFARLTGYSIRRNSAASLALYAEASATPVAPEYMLIRRGTKIQSKDGQSWEIADDYRILPGSFTPVRIVTSYDDISASYVNSAGIPVQTKALVKLTRGSTTAVLVNDLGDRLPSDTNFKQAGPGHILKLTSQRVAGVFGAPPDVTRREFAVVSVGSMEFDQFPGSVLYLDRPWDQDDYFGKWTLEDRSITVVQGESREDRQVAPEDGTNLILLTQFYPVIGGSSEEFVVSGLLQSTIDSGLDVFVNGVEWRETTSLLFEGPSENVFEVDFDQVDRAIIRFGSGVNGAVVPSGADIVIRYRTGGGVAGNITQGSVETVVPGTLVPPSGVSPSVFLSNPYTIASGGMDRESLEEAKSHVRAFVRANDRAVSSEDYNYLAANFSNPSTGRIAHATAVLNRNAVPREQNIIWVYVWAAGTGGQYVSPSLPLKKSLYDYLAQRKMITDEVVIVDGVQTRIPLYFFYRYSREKEEWVIRESVRSAIYGVVSSLKPGDSLLLSRLYEAMEAIDGIQMALFHHPSINQVPSSEVELLVNSVQDPARGRLLTAVDRGALTVQVSNPESFAAGSIIMFLETGRTPTVAEVDSITGSVITLRSATPLLDSYSVPDTAGRGCEVYNSDFVGVGWQYEKKIDVHVKYTTQFGTVITMDQAIKTRIKNFFTYTVRPEQSLTKAQLEYLVTTLSGVVSATVSFGSFDGTTEAVTSSLRERLTLGHLTINGVPY